MGMMLPDRVMHRKGRARQSPAYQGQEDRRHELEFSDASHEVVQRSRELSPCE